MTEDPAKEPITSSSQRSAVELCLRSAVAVLFILSPALLMGRSLGRVEGKLQPTQISQVSPARIARLKRGINLSHWFAQSPNGDYSEKHLDTFTTAQDLALIKSMGFDHVRFTVEPAPLIDSGDPGTLQKAYLGRFDHALDLILAEDLAVI